MPNAPDVVTRLAVIDAKLDAYQLSIEQERAFQKQRVVEIQKTLGEHDVRIDVLEKRSERQLGWGATLMFLGGVIAWVIEHWDKLFPRN